jgi:hypothetical protein
MEAVIKEWNGTTWMQTYKLLNVMDYAQILDLGLSVPNGLRGKPGNTFLAAAGRRDSLWLSTTMDTAFQVKAWEILLLSIPTRTYTKTVAAQRNNKKTFSDSPSESWITTLAG